MKITQNLSTTTSKVDNKKTKIKKTQTENMLKKTVLFLMMTLHVWGTAQTLGSHLDKGKMYIGDVATLRIKVFDLNGKDVESAPLKKLLPFHFEVLKDSIIKTQKEYERIVEFQIFEVGEFQLPALEFRINGQLQKTIPYTIEVSNPAKQDDQINDIMQNKEVKLSIGDYWAKYKFYILAAITVIAIIFLIMVFIKNRKAEKNSPKATTNKALRALDALKKKKYRENGNYRQYYVEMADITRNFLSEQYQIPAHVLLTDDLIDYLKNNNTISPENEKIVESVLLNSDLVKFAKTFPDELTMDEDWSKLREFVKNSFKDLELEKLLRKDV